MTNRCDICVDSNCEGRKDCNCDTCSKKDSCYRELHPTIRITTKCTQECDHCCFDCSPRKSDMMAVDKAKEIKRFIDSNNIQSLNLMGGEFFCNPDWFEVLSILVKNIKCVRLVTNSDWAASEKISDKVVEFGKENRNVVFALSFDKWHTKKNIEAAYNILGFEKVDFKLAVEEDSNDNAIVPVGRGSYHYGIYSMFATYCSKPDRKYSFLIDEIGKIYKCGFGIWDYANIEDYVEGGFAERFKEFNDKFYKAWVGNCTQCGRMYLNGKKKDRK